MKETILIIMISCVSHSFGVMFRQISLYLEYKKRSPFFRKLFFYLHFLFSYIIGIFGALIFGFAEEAEYNRLYDISVANAKKARRLAKLECSGTYLQRIRYAAEEGDELAMEELPILTRMIDEVTKQISDLLCTLPDKRLAERLARDFDSHRNLPDGYAYETIRDLHFLYREQDNYLANGLTEYDCDNYLRCSSLRFDFDVFLRKAYSSIGIDI